MQEKKKIFQPKVIIGSITSFIVAAVGVVAVFFPDLFNLQKKNLNEAEFMVLNDANREEVWKFVESHQGKAIKLTLGFCPNKDKTDVGASPIDEKSKSYALTQMVKKRNEWTDVELKQGGGTLESFMETFNGGFAHNNSINSINSMELEAKKVRAGFSSNIVESEDSFTYEVKGLAYSGDIVEGYNATNFKLENFTMSDPDERLVIKTLGKENYIYGMFDKNHISNYIKDTDPMYEKLLNTCETYTYEDPQALHGTVEAQVMLYFSGYFFVNEIKTKTVDIDSRVYRGDYSTLELDPISRKEFELKSY